MDGRGEWGRRWALARHERWWCEREREPPARREALSLPPRWPEVSRAGWRACGHRPCSRHISHSCVTSPMNLPPTLDKHSATFCVPSRLFLVHAPEVE